MGMRTAVDRFCAARTFTVTASDIFLCNMDNFLFSGALNDDCDEMGL